MTWRPLIFIVLLGSVCSAARGPSDPLPSGFQIFPPNSVWNTRVDNLPVSSSNTVYMSNMQTGHSLFPVFGNAYYAGQWNGIPYNIICGGVTPMAPVAWQAGAYITESSTLSASGLPIPTDAIVEGDPASLNPANDNHLLLVDTCTNVGYEIFQASRVFSGGVVTSSWTIVQLSTWGYTSNQLWPDTWTSANAAGTSMLPELVNYNEVAAGAINHAVGITMTYTYQPHVWPAKHDANTGGVGAAPFGTRVRLKASYDISGFSSTNKIILMALKKYGAILIDNGTSWNLAGAPNTNWNDSDLANLETVLGSNFEVVDESSLEITPTSGQAQQLSFNENVITGPVIVNGSVVMKKGDL